MAVVWDAPRTKIHSQIGEHALFYQPEITKRYDYFRKIFSPGGAAELDYKKLSVAEQVFVVDTPVPISELE